MAHDIFPFVNIFVDTNILTRNYHEFLFHFKSVAIYYTIYDNIKIFNRENDLVYSKSEKSDLDPGKVLQKEFDRDWELDEYKDYKNDCLDILGVMDSRKAKGEEIELIKSNLFEKMEEIV